MVATQSDLRSARENTRNAIDSVVASITREYEVARANEQSVSSALEKAKSEIQNINRKEFQLASLERDVQTNRQLYNLFMNRFKETSAAGDLQSTVARVIDPAIVPGGPIKPQKTRIITTSLVIGLALGILLAILLEFLDNTVRTGDDVESKLQAPLLGILQWVRVKNKKFELQRTFVENPHSPFTESVRTLRTGVLMSALDNPHKVVLVTSSLPREGKTSVAMNLAFALAQVKRTCLIDADMRRPMIARILGMDANAPGLSHLVAGTEPPEKCIHKHPQSELYFIPSGAVPPNPLELLSSKRFGEVLKELEKSFDIIVLDSPPVQLVSDAVVLASQANALVYVVHADSTPYQVAKGGLELLKKGKAHLLGVVLNQLDFEKVERYHGYGKYFSYGGKYKQYKGYGYYGGEKK
jgi:capsular exopolysaccharide synthesis family protein